MSKKNRMQMEAERKARGQALARRNDVLELGSGWSVLGDHHKVYMVEFRYPTYDAPALYSCTCTDYARHEGQVTYKHGHAVAEFCTQQAQAIEALYSQSAVPASIPSPAMEMAVVA